MSDIVTLGDALTWPTADKIKLLGTLRSELWNELSRPEQKEPEGDWRIWYLMGGRGSGKSRTGAETFCSWIHEHPSGEWAIVAPTFADARDTCVESASSGILHILGPAVQNWNRSLGEILLVDGTKIYLDGADDGALRIQGKNLRGAWCILGSNPVRCLHGDIPIESVRPGDYVLTRSGWRHINATTLTKRDAPVIAIRTGDGSEVVCTSDHPIYVEGRGWVRAGFVEVGDCLITTPPLAPRHGSTTAVPASIGSTAAITRAGRSLDTEECIPSSGRSATAPSRTGTSFITATKTAETTAQRISNSCRKAITTVITSGERFGIRNRRIGSAPERRSRGRGGRTDRSLVKSAARSSRPVRVAVTSPAAPSYARSVVVSVSDAGRGDVYDITVNGDHEFFAGGVLVHNCDEVGLWNQWDRAWNESLAFAVRHEPARLVATGTPKMGHGLVKLLVEDPLVPKAQMRTSDNVGNLHPSAVRELYTKYGGTRLGSQELDGEWLEAIEGDMLKRAWWKYYDPDLIGGRGRKGIQAERLPRFQMILLSIDTPLKDKETSDFVALQAWGVIGADRYLLDTRVERLSYDQCKRAVKEMSQTMRQTFRGIQHRCLIENAGYGVELYLDLQRELGGIHKISPGGDGNKTMRALAASSDLETGNCFLPGHASADLSGPDPNRSPAWVLAFVDELALFDNGQNDDQVDAWSQAMNWLRSRSPTPMRTASALRNVRQRNPFIGTTRRGNR